MESDIEDQVSSEQLFEEKEKSRCTVFWEKYKPLISMLAFFLVIGGVPSLILYFEKNRVMKVVHFIQKQGIMGNFYYVIILTIGTVICIPTTFLELASGFIFGFWISCIVSLIGKCLGSLLSFLLGRRIFKSYLRENVMARYPIIQAMEESIIEKPMTVIFLTRIAFIPMAVKNYGISIIRSVPLGKFTLCTVVGSIPFTLVWSYFGSASEGLIALSGSQETKSQKALKISLLVIGILAAILFVLVVRHYTKKHISRISQNAIKSPTRAKDQDQNPSDYDKEKFQSKAISVETHAISEEGESSS
jgi:uncharacterized membrane protein YdjX (TVP38/TMEM64 family)